MAASKNEVDQYTGLTAEQHARFMNEPELQAVLRRFKAKLHKEEQAKQSQTTESPISSFFSNPFATSRSSSSSNAAQSMPVPVADATPKIKILIYGDNIVDKHALANHFSDKAEQRSKELELEGKRVKVAFREVDDNRFACRPEQWMKDAHVICLCYNVYNQDSFDRIENYIQEIKHEALPNVKVILVADKSHLTQEHVAEGEQERVVTEQEGKQLVVKLELAGHVEVSTETGEGCKELLEVAARLELKARELQARTQLSSSSSSSASGASSSTRFGFGRS